MLKSFGLLLCTLFCMAQSILAQNFVNVQFKFKCINNNEGYIYDSKLLVFVNGKLAKESSVKRQDEDNEITVQVPNNDVKNAVEAILYSKPKDEWEARTVKNGYSIDWKFDDYKYWTEDQIITLTFDIKKQNIDIKRENKKAETPMTANVSKPSDLSTTKKNEKAAPKNNYQTALDNLNSYLSNFDNGYYGYFEVKDGHIYIRFKAGKYNKFKMEDIEGAVIQPQYARVIFKCKDNDKCIESDWKVNGREEYTQFLQPGEFNHQELANLLNNFRDAYLGKKGKHNTASNPKTSSGATASNVSNTSSNNLEQALSELNSFLVTLDEGRYKSIEIKNGYIINHYHGGQLSKAKIEDIDKADINTQYNYAKLACKGDQNCVYSTITERYHEYFNFNANGNDLTKLGTLLNNFLIALKGNNSGVNISSNNQSETERKKGKNIEKKEDIDDEYNEDFDALENAAAGLNDAMKELSDASMTIPANTNVKLINVFEKNSNYNEAKKYFGKEGVTQQEMTFAGDNYFRGNIKFEDGNIMYFNNAVLEVLRTKTQAQSGSKYAQALNSLNDYIFKFNNEVFRDIEVKDDKVYFNYVYLGKVYYSTIKIQDLKQNVMFEKSDATTLKIKCLSNASCFYSTYNNQTATHFKYFTYSNSDVEKLKSLLQTFIDAL